MSAQRERLERQALLASLAPQVPAPPERPVRAEQRERLAPQVLGPPERLGRQGQEEQLGPAQRVLPEQSVQPVQPDRPELRAQPERRLFLHRCGRLSLLERLKSLLRTECTQLTPPGSLSRSTALRLQPMERRSW